MEVIINNVRYVPAETLEVKGKTLKQKVMNYMLDREWVTVEEISRDLNAKQTSVSSTIRNLRKPGTGMTVYTSRGNGTTSYFLTL